MASQQEKLKRIAALQAMVEGGDGSQSAASPSSSVPPPGGGMFIPVFVICMVVS